MLFVAIFAALLLWLYDVKAGYSAALGGSVCVISNALFAYLLFQRRGARAAKQIVRGFYRGELVKIVTTVLCFIVIFKFVPINVAAFFIGFVVGQLVFWVALLITKSRSNV